jgi:hypothetical protein
MAKKYRPRRGRGLSSRANDVRVNILVRKADRWIIQRHAFLSEALRRIARREWTPRWFEDGSLTGVETMPPPRRPDELVPIPCGSVECRKGWILNAQKQLAVTTSPAPRTEPLRTLLDFFEDDLVTRVRRVSAELALKRIATGEWRALWCENGELAGVAAA